MREDRRTGRSTNHQEPATPEWNSVHVYYFEEDKDRLLLECVRPLFVTLSGGESRRYFLRHWRQGPHLRLCFEASRPHFEEEILPMTRGMVLPYLSRHPSTAVLDPDRLLPLHRHLALVERESGPLVPLMPDNSVRAAAHDRRADVLGSEVLASLIEDFYVDSDGLAFEMLEQVKGGFDRRTLGLDLMVAVAHQLTHHLLYGFVSYRSHAEVFIAGSSDPRTLREFLDTQYRVRDRQLAARVREVTAALDRGGDDLPLVSSFIALLRGFRRRVLSLIESGEVALGRLDPSTDARLAERMQHITAHSEFHNVLQAEAEMREGLYGDARFQAHRVMVSLLYMHLARIGVRPLERYTLCHLLANTVERDWGTTAVEVLRYSHSM